jgi:hypothetical protein
MEDPPALSHRDFTCGAHKALSKQALHVRLLSMGIGPPEADGQHGADAKGGEVPL